MKGLGLKRATGMVLSMGAIPYGLIEGSKQYLVYLMKRQMQVMTLLHHGQKTHKKFILEIQIQMKYFTWIGLRTMFTIH